MVDTMTDDFNEEDDEVWAVHNSTAWYLGVFMTGIALAVLVSYVVASL